MSRRSPSHKFRLFSKWLRLVRKLVLISLSAGLLFLVLMLAWTWRYSELISPPASLFLEDRHGQFLSESGIGPLGYWPVDQVPSRLETCLLTAEDRRFYQHSGIDGRALGRAIVNNFSGGPRQGASTLAMQIARMQRPGPRTYSRKLTEMFTAWLLVRRHGHSKVLRHYLTLMPQGRRIHGASYAARRYFQKPLKDLSWAEAALLAALPRAPGRMNVYRPTGLETAKNRARLILKQAAADAHLDSPSLKRALQSLATFQPPPPEIRPNHALHAISRIQQEMSHPNQALSMRPIATSLDLNLQDQVDELAAKTLDRLRGRAAGNIAVIVAERETGKIRSYLGSDWYEDTEHAGAINYAHTKRSSGSTLKPFLYAVGLDSGEFHPNSVLADLPFLMANREQQYGLTNFDATYLGPMLYRNALANSRNIPAVRILKTVGIDAMYQALEEMDLANSSHQAEFYGLGMAIGGVYVTLEQLVTGYLMLSNQGRGMKLQWLEEPAGETVSNQIISTNSARQISLFLSDPQARQPAFPRGNALEFKFPVAIKTGTSQGFRDAWCLAYSEAFVVGVWIGRADHQPMNKVGGIEAAKLVNQIMVLLHPLTTQGVDVKPFPKPKDSIGVRICRFSGLLATEDCDQVGFEYLQRGSANLESTNVHQWFAVDQTTGHQAGPTTPTHHIQLQKALLLPGIYATWAARQNLGPPKPPHTQKQHITLDIQTPVHQSRLVLDPHTPAAFQTLPLRAIVDPPVAEIVWLVNGEPFQSVGYPYEVRWPLKQGTHHFQIKLPRANIQSDIVSIQIAP